MIEVFINGEKQMIREGMSMLEVLKERDVEPQMVAVEVNGELVDRENYETLAIGPGDKIEYLFYMAGGVRRGRRFRRFEPSLTT